jgi:hypothetical protein
MQSMHRLVTTVYDWLRLVTSGYDFELSDYVLFLYLSSISRSWTLVIDMDGVNTVIR